MLPGRPIVLSGRPIVLSGRPIVLPGRPIVLPGRPCVLPSRPSVLPGRPIVLPGRPIVLSQCDRRADSKQCCDIAGVLQQQAVSAWCRVSPTPASFSAGSANESPRETDATGVVTGCRPMHE